VKNWNYHIALEDYPGQVESEGELGAPEWRRSRTGLSDALIVNLREWRQQCVDEYFVRWDGRESGTTSEVRILYIRHDLILLCS